MPYLVFQERRSRSGADNLCISQLIAIYSPQATQSKPQTPGTLFRLLAWPYAVVTN